MIDTIAQEWNILEILQHRLFHGIFTLRLFWDDQLQLLALPFVTAAVFGLVGAVMQLGWKRGYVAAKTEGVESFNAMLARLSSLTPPS